MPFSRLNVSRPFAYFAGTGALGSWRHSIAQPYTLCALRIQLRQSVGPSIYHIRMVCSLFALEATMHGLIAYWPT